MPDPQRPFALILPPLWLDHVFLADYLIAGLFGFRVDFDFLDGSRRCPHAELDLGAFESRAGGAGRRADLVSVSQEQFAVGADVDDEYLFVLVVRFLGNQHAHIVRTDEAGLNGQDMDIGPGIYPEPEIAGLDIERALDRGNEGRTADVLGVQTKEDVMHGRIEDDRKVVDDVTRVRAVLCDILHHSLDDLIQALNDRLLHGLQARARIAHGIGDA